jgi:hypothetical protein
MLKVMPTDGLPSMIQSLEMINAIQKKKPWHNYKRGRKRHGIYRKQVWVKRQPPNTYEPFIIPKFRFGDYKNKILLGNQNMSLMPERKIFHVEKQRSGGPSTSPKRSNRRKDRNDLAV